MSTIKKKLLVLGDDVVGKSCLLIKFSTDEFTEGMSTDDDDYDDDDDDEKGLIFVKDITVDDKQVELKGYDLPFIGSFQFGDRCTDTKDKDVILICFSIDCRKSFDNVLNFWGNEHNKKNYLPQAPAIILVGTKLDLRNNENTIRQLMKENQEPVRFAEGVDMAEKVGAYGYKECSAKTGEGVREVFEFATLAALKNAAAKNAAVANTALDNPALENAALGNAALENAALKNATRENAARENAALENAALENSAQNTALEKNIKNTRKEPEKSGSECCYVL